MRVVLSIFKNEIFISALGIVSLIILIWFAGPYFEFADIKILESVVGRLVAIIICLSMWVIRILWQQQKVKRANRDFSENFNIAGKKDSRELSQNEQEVGTLETKFSEAVTLLKSSSKAKGKVSLYELPWYIILGPPGSGKTTALVNSGLRFPLADRFGSGPVRGEGGTRNCDWWFTEDAVLIDTAGRYTSQDSHGEVDSAGWLGFLNLLKRHRKRRPINGALVAVSLEDLLTDSEQERRQLANSIKTRIEELYQQLQVRFPVYVIFTKCDLVAGFMEYFEDLSAEERSQVWGVSFPFETRVDASETIKNFSSEYDALMSRLSGGVARRLQNERDSGRCSKIFAFPQQMSSLKGLISHFLEDVFGSSRYGERCLLRGCYFTSGTQEGTPIDRVIGSVARSFGISQDVTTARNAQGRSYFMTTLLNQVIFQEAELVGANRKFEKQRKMLQSAAYAAAGAVTLFFVIGWTTSFAKNQNYVYQSKIKLDRYRDKLEKFESSDDIEHRIERLNAARELSNLDQEFQGGVPFFMGFGLFQGDKISKAGSDVYKQELNSLLVPEIERYLITDLNDENDDMISRYISLRAYLIFTKSKDALEGKFDSLFLERIKALFEYAFPGDNRVIGELESHFQEMLGLGYKAPTTNLVLVEQARDNLSLNNPEVLFYRWIKSDIPEDFSHFLSSPSILGYDAKGFFEDRTGYNLEDGVNRFYTKKGYNEFFKKRNRDLKEWLNKQKWVLGEEARFLTLNDREIKELEKKVERVYLAEYLENWQSYLDKVFLLKPEDNREMASLLEVLASNSQSPILKVLKEVRDNASLFSYSGGFSSLLSSSRDKYTKKYGEKRSVNEKSERVYESQEQEILHKKFIDLSKWIDADDEGNRPIDELLNLLSSLAMEYEKRAIRDGDGSFESSENTKVNRLIDQLRYQARRQPEPIKTWMGQLAQYTTGLAVSNTKLEINKLWSNNIYQKCNKAISGRYPFSARSDDDVPLTDFARLFAPDGLIDNFYKEHVSSYVDESGSVWLRKKKVAGVSLNISDKAIRNFQAAASIRDTYFQQGGDTPSINFSLRPKQANQKFRVRFDLDGQRLRVRKGKVNLGTLVWPYNGEGATRKASIVHDRFGKIDNDRELKSFHNQWAVFRLFDVAKSKRLSSDKIEFTFEFGKKTTTWIILSETSTNPFDKREMYRFTCLKRL